MHRLAELAGQSSGIYTDEPGPKVGLWGVCTYGRRTGRGGESGGMSFWRAGYIPCHLHALAIPASSSGSYLHSCLYVGPCIIQLPPSSAPMNRSGPETSNQ